MVKLLIEYENSEIDTKQISGNLDGIFKQLIANKERNIVDSDTFHLVVRTVANSDDHKIKILLYYFFEQFYESEKDFIICINYIIKDLASPNDFVRGLAIQFISKLENHDYASMFIKGVKENLVNRNAYVRINAAFCLGELANRFDLDVEESF